MKPLLKTSNNLKGFQTNKNQLTFMQKGNFSLKIKMMQKKDNSGNVNVS